MGWGKLIAVAALPYAVVYGCYRAYLRYHPRRIDWKHGDVLIVAATRRTLQTMVLGPLGWPVADTAFGHPLLVLKRQGRNYVLDCHNNKNFNTLEDQPHCLPELGDFLQQQQREAHDVVLEVWRSPTFPASSQTYEEVVAKAHRGGCGQLFGMALLLQQLGYFGHLSPREVRAQSLPGNFQRFLRTSSFQRIHVCVFHSW
jgi:hypothetical protein